jgi:orotidine-5'-phosphate decarboxylase
VIPAKERLIPALDTPTGDEAVAWARRLKNDLSIVKIGLRLFVSDGPSIVGRVRDEGLRVFLDLKLHDIPSTVEAAARAAAKLDIALLTIHASGGPSMIRAAADGVEGQARILAVTVLTSLSQSEQHLIFGGGVASVERVSSWARMAIENGADGVVCSPLEAAALKGALPRAKRGEEPIVVTPGIRTGGGTHGDQSRTAGAGDAIRSGATHLVVGRPILEAADPSAAAKALISEIEEALK